MLDLRKSMSIALTLHLTYFSVTWKAAFVCIINCTKEKKEPGERMTV